MTRTMYDSTNASAIPLTAAMVAGYLAPSPYAWSAADWARFPTAVKVRIAVRASTNDGHVLDVERGDATPAQAPGWVQMRRPAGADPTVYCSESAWPTVRAAFAAAGVAEPHYWVAAYPGGGATIPAGAVAHQYIDPPGSGGDWDLSAVADYWPGVDGGGDMPLTQADANLVAMTIWNWGLNAPTATDADKAWLLVREARDAAVAANAGVAHVDSDVLAGTATLTAALHALPTGGQVDVPTLVSALAAPLAGALGPLLPAGTTPAQMLAALAAQLDK